MQKIFSYIHRNYNKPIEYHLLKVKDVTKGKLQYNISKYRALSGISISTKQLISSFSLSFHSTTEIAHHFRTRQAPYFFVNPSEKRMIVKAIQDLYPKTIKLTINKADQICDHSFDLLGSSITHLGAKINWHQDFKSGYEWPRVYYKEIYYKDYKKGYDVKVPRELSRFQHAVTLGKAYWYTENEKHAQEFVNQVDDWIVENPPEIGANWQCTMDVAIRVVNWIWGFYFFLGSKALTDDFIIRFLKSCLIHGRHIRNNLEWNEHVTSNHYISDLVGLVFLGIMFPEFKEAEEWRTFGTKELLSELEKQVYDDGMAYEASTSYHRLDLELFYTPALLARLSGDEWPDWAWNKIYKMFEFTRGIVKPNGKILQIGDNDSGRLQTLSELPEDTAQTYLFPIAAVLFNDPSFKFKDVNFSEEAFWLLGANAYEKYSDIQEKSDLKNLPSCEFTNSGIYVIRSNNHYCLISCGANGQNGNGGHAHNDKLSFELNIKGKDVIVDPGTYLYTGDYRMRNLFRSTAYHNTIMVDEKEINEFDPLRLFQIKDNCETIVHFFGKNGNTYQFIGDHKGYLRLQSPVHHKRTVSHHLKKGHWGIKDELTGPKDTFHKINQYFHFSSKCNVTKAQHTVQDFAEIIQSVFSNTSSEISALEWKTFNINIEEELNLYFLIGCDHSINVEIQKGWISKGYGLKEKAPIIELTANAHCPVNVYTFIFENV